MLDTTKLDSGADTVAAIAELFGKCRMVDLSATIENDIPRWPTHPPLVLHHTISIERDGYFTNTLFMPEHIATHCDAPAHIHAHMSHATVDSLPVDIFVGPAAVIDLSPLNLDAGETVGPEVIEKWEAENGAIQKGDIAIFNFGWLKRHWRKDALWTIYAKNSPGLTEPAVKMLYERGIKALGSDLIACDQAIKDGVPEKSWAHEEYMLPNGIPLLEELANLESLPARCFFMALPLKIKDGSGSPLRAVALVAKE